MESDSDSGRGQRGHTVGFIYYQIFKVENNKWIQKGEKGKKIVQMFLRRFSAL